MKNNLKEQIREVTFARNKAYYVWLNDKTPDNEKALRSLSWELTRLKRELKEIEPEYIISF